MMSDASSINVEMLIAEYQAALPEGTTPLATWRQRMVAWSEGRFRNEDMRRILMACGDAADEVGKRQTGAEGDFHLNRELAESLWEAHVLSHNLEGEHLPDITRTTDQLNAGYLMSIADHADRKLQTAASTAIESPSSEA